MARATKRGKSGGRKDENDKRIRVKTPAPSDRPTFEAPKARLTVTDIVNEYMDNLPKGQR